jgi:hypothetical protein
MCLDLAELWDGINMKNFFKRLVGLDKLEAEKVALQSARDQAIAEAVQAQKDEALAKMTPKDRATAKGEPWVAVLDTHVNKDNVRNGFFELDWNDLFVLQLKQAGYGFDGDPDEEIVDRWFRDLARTMLGEDGQDTTRGAGYINVVPITKDKSEVS